MYFDCQGGSYSAGLHILYLKYSNKGLDINYHTMKVEIEKYYTVEKECDFKKMHEGLLQQAHARILLEYCARRLYLRLLLKKFPSLTPTQYRNAQLDCGMLVITNIIEELKRLNPTSIEIIIKGCNNDLKVF
jgi:hypothetical protein